MLPYSTTSLVLVALMALSTLTGCRQEVESTASPSPSPVESVAPDTSPTTPSQSTNSVPPSDPSAIQLEDHSATLQESWEAYCQRFIQSDGRVIDWEAEERSTSEGQAYAMLRAVLMDDPKIFELTFKWAEENLRRQDAGKPLDSLWSWKWGKVAANRWGVQDANFASDGDIDAITALIFASRRWNRPDYLRIAQIKLKDLWTHSTATVGNERYLLPGPKAAFQQPTTIQLNPSYVAPYAFRIFAQVDPTRDWMSLVRSSYQLLEKSSELSAVNLPSDWVALDIETKRFLVLVEPSPIVSRYSFDAYRVWWRVALDAAWFDAPEAWSYLRDHLGHLQQLWRSQQSIPARLDLQGKSLVNYQAMSQYGMLYAAFQLIDRGTAQQIYQQKLAPNYRDGIWDNNSAYYTQNLVWFGLVPPTAVSPSLLNPSNTAQEPNP